ncbi:hypothetical protein ACWDUD_25010 [Rhodococcus sp. NPDC003382]
MTDLITVHTDFGSITIGNELPDTVTLAVDDRIGAQRVLVLQIDEAYQVMMRLSEGARLCSTKVPTRGRVHCSGCRVPVVA